MCKRSICFFCLIVWCNCSWPHLWNTPRCIFVHLTSCRMNACSKYHMSSAVFPVRYDPEVCPTPFIACSGKCDAGKWIFIFSVWLLRYISLHFLVKLLLRLWLQLWLLPNRVDLLKCKVWLNNLVSHYVAFLENCIEFQVLIIYYLFLFCRILIHLNCSRRQHQKNRISVCTSNYTSKYEYRELFSISCRSELKFTFQLLKIQ